MLNLILLALDLYQWLILARVIFSWFPDCYRWPGFRILSNITDPYLDLFRGIIPPIANIDFSPFFAFLVLNWIRMGLARLILG